MDAHQAPLSMGFPRQEYWSGLPSPSPGDLPDPEIKLMSLVFASGFLAKTREAWKKETSVNFMPLYKPHALT